MCRQTINIYELAGGVDSVSVLC